MNFLKEYPLYCAEMTDAPLEFHQAVALGILACACGNNFYFPFGDSRIYPNMYLILMGTSSDTRKSTSLQYGKNILMGAKPETIHPNEFSHEKLLQLLQKNPTGGFFYSEFLSLMGLLSRDYMQGTKAFLTEVYDCPSVYRRETIGGESIEINNPVISILTATTIDWFLERINESDIMGGLLTRFLIILGQKKTSPIPIPPPVDVDKKVAMIEEIKRLSEIQGIATLTPEARKLHNQWYIKHSMSLSGFRYGAFFHRLQIYLLKIAMLIELAESSSLKVSEKSMKESINFVNWVGSNIRKIENNDLVFNRFQRNLRTVKQYLKGKGNLSRSELVRGTHLSKRDIDEVIQTLKETEEIKESKEFNNETKRAVIFYETSHRFT